MVAVLRHDSQCVLVSLVLGTLKEEEEEEGVGEDGDKVVGGRWTPQRLEAIWLPATYKPMFGGQSR